jgi:hypothetical protein
MGRLSNDAEPQKSWIDKRYEVLRAAGFQPRRTAARLMST